MSEFGYPFGNLPPGCYEDDPRAPWNEEDLPVIEQEEIVDEIFNLLSEMGLEPTYKGMDQIRALGYTITVS